MEKKDNYGTSDDTPMVSISNQMSKAQNSQHIGLMSMLIQPAHHT
jgi:hypothetical protein